jgi:8-oxo-dGTP pyrophosphatase MutT (NUDIX family)
VRFDVAADRLAALAARGVARPGDGGLPPLPRGPAGLDVTFVDGRLRPRFEQTGTARAAAVLALIFPDEDGEARIVLTERLSYDGHHSGEVSLPGGKAEPFDADETATALREASEEVGLDPAAADVRVIGRLDEVFIPVSDFRITPVVALAGRAPALEPNPSEVARIVTPRLATFLPDAELEVVERSLGGWALRYGGYRIDGLHVWGATARILGQLGALIDPATVAEA